MDEGNENNYNHMVAYAFALNKAIARYPDRKAEHKCMQHLRRLQSWGYPKRKTRADRQKKKKERNDVCIGGFQKAAKILLLREEFWRRRLGVKLP